MQSLVSKDVELISRIIKSFKALGFFIFDKRSYPDVINVLKLTNTIKLFKVSELNGNKGYYILEPDITTCIHTCRDRCASENSLSSKCFSECLYPCRARIIEHILDSLSNNVASTPTSLK